MLMNTSRFHHLTPAYTAKAYLSRRLPKRPPVPCISDHPAILARLLPAPADRLDMPRSGDRSIACWLMTLRTLISTAR